MHQLRWSASVILLWRSGTWQTIWTCTTCYKTLKNTMNSSFKENQFLQRRTRTTKMRRRKLAQEAFKNLQPVECFRGFRPPDRSKIYSQLPAPPRPPNRKEIVEHQVQHSKVRPRVPRDKAPMLITHPSTKGGSRCPDRQQLVQWTMISLFRALSYNNSLSQRMRTRRSSSSSRTES